MAASRLSQGFATTLFYDTDVVVIGAGGAGLAAAASAAEQGARVAVLEQMPFVGGNTIRTLGAFNAVMHNTEADSLEKHFEDTMRYGGFRSDPALVHRLVTEAPEALNWLESIGVSFSPEIYKAFGSMHKRAHNTTAPFGAGYVEGLLQLCERRGVQIVTDTKVTSFVLDSRDKRRIHSLKTQLHDGTVSDIATHGTVIVAGGGFAANRKMCSFFDPRLNELNSTNHPGADGALLWALQDIGATLTGMDFIQLTPVYEFNPQLIGTVSPVRDFIFVNSEGLRFVEETSTHSVISEAILRIYEQTIYCVMNNRAKESMKSDVRHLFEKGLQSGKILKEETIESLAIAMGVPVENLKKSSAAFNSGIKEKSSPFYAAKIRLATHYTMGGIRINEQAQVLDRNNIPFHNLFAAGEITGGIHGTNRLGGNGITDAIVFGKIAGKNAALSRMKIPSS